MIQPFRPDYLPPNISIEELFKLQPKLLEATKLLSKTDEMLRLSPVSTFMVGYFSMKESVQSTKIEGTQATFTEVLEANANKTENNANHKCLIMFGRSCVAPAVLPRLCLVSYPCA